MRKNIPVYINSVTVRSGAIQKELASTVKVGQAYEIGEASPPVPDSTMYTAIWDTGATSTAITKRLAEKLVLEQTGTLIVQGVTGSSICKTFLISLHLPNNVVIPELEVSDCEGDIGCDVLIGMDVIGKGDFAVSNYKEKTTFSFRLPSISEIDFTRQMPHQFIAHKPHEPGRNDFCPCGSGKKYKNCCAFKIAD